MKKTLAFLLALLLTFTMLPVSAFAAENPTFTVTSATGKAGDEVTVVVEIANNPGIWAYNYGIEYDTTRLEKVSYTGGGMDGGIWTINEKVLWESSTFENSTYNGETLVMKFKIKEDAPAGDAEIKIKDDFFACNCDGNIVNADLVAGKVTVEGKLETIIPLTKDNHDENSEIIRPDKYGNVGGLKIEGVKLVDWTQWKQGGNYQSQSITIYVDPESKDDIATLSLVLLNGQTGSGPLIDNPATVDVQLKDGVGSYWAGRMVIGTGGLAPRLNLDIYFELVKEECEHEWNDATCTEPKTCSKCGETEGEALGHSWVDADCDTPKTCSVCSETEGEALGHSWVDADCDTPKTCSACGATEGEALGHSWVDADCDTPKTCTVCGATEGEALGHNWGATSYTWTEGADTLVVEVAKVATLNRYGDRYFSVPAGQDLTIVLDTEGAIQQFDDVATATRLEHTFTDNCKITVTAEELAKHFLSDDFRAFIPEMYGDILQSETSGVLYIMAFNGSRTYSFVIEVLEGEAEGNGALSCTATRVCQNDATHTESAEATVTSEVEKEPTCTESGITKYTATFDVDWAETQTNSKADTEALGHDYEAVVTEPTCTEGGYTTYTCSACGDSYVADEVPALGHDWEVSYEWAEDGKSCTATRVCQNDAEHVETAEAAITSVVAKPATCVTMGDTQYTATFAEDWAETQHEAVTDIPVDEDSHEWGEWKVVREATYEEKGLKERECKLCEDKENDDIPKLTKPSEPSKPSKPSDKPNPGVTIIVPGDKGEEEKNPNTGAPVFDMTFAGVVVLAATATVLEIKRRK